jgi:ferrochelatase
MIGVLLVNLGTPDEPTAHAVRRYLREFLMDPRVIDIPSLPRWLLVNLLIVPFRAPKSARAYRKIWTEEGSPLRVHTQALTEAVQKKMGDGFLVRSAMRYGRPDIRSALESLTRHGAESIRVLPLYPQYASSSTGSTQAEVFRLAGKISHCPPVHFLLPFFDHPGFVRAFADVGAARLKEFQPDHVLFSFHGLPERQIRNADIGGNFCLQSPTCCDEIVPANGLCYRAHCFHTARAIAGKLGLPTSQFTVCFQSRLGRTPWIRPFTDHVIPELLTKGQKRLAVFCPAFVADCLETLEEIGIRAREQAEAKGGELLLIPSLNEHPTWVQAVGDIIQGK